MSLVVDLALHIAYPKLSAHATVRRDCGTCPAGQKRDPATHSVRCPLHDSGENHGSAQAYAFGRVPADRRARSLRCIILRLSCCVTLDIGSHNNNTRSRHGRHENTLYAWRCYSSCSCSAGQHSHARRAQLLVAYARGREMCLRKHENYRRTTARSLDVSMRYIASKPKTTP